MDAWYTNPVIILAAAAAITAQVISFLIGRAAGRPVKLADPGGMPSSHAATIGAATTVIGLRSGVTNDLFGLAVVVTAIVVHDAYRVRWAVGEQAGRLNDVIAASKLKDKAPVVVWRGHRIRELIVGLLLGIGLACLGYKLFYA